MGSGCSRGLNRGAVHGADDLEGSLDFAHAVVDNLAGVEPAKGVYSNL